MRPRFVFRVDGSPQIGAGHMTRCHALAQAVTDAGGVCAFASTRESFNLLPAEALQWMTCVEISGNASADSIGREYGHGADWLIVDHYGLDHEFECAARGWAKNILVIDDLPDRRHDCDLLLDQNQDEENPWKEYLPGEAKVLAGPRYALLRSDIRAALNRQSPEDLRAVLTLGAADPNQRTQRLLPVVRSVLPSGWTLEVVAGPANGTAGEIAELSKAHGAEFHHAPADIAGIFARASLAITAGGSTVWELAALGVPMVVLQDSIDQLNVVSSIVSSGAAVAVKSDDPSWEQQVTSHVETLALDAGQRQAMSRSGRKLVDGEGSKRVASEMMAMLG